MLSICVFFPGTPRMSGNEKSTDGKSGEAETDTVLDPKTAEAPASAKKHKKKKKKKTVADGKDGQQKGITSTADETSKQETTELVSTYTIACF